MLPTPNLGSVSTDYVGREKGLQTFFRCCCWASVSDCADVADVSLPGERTIAVYMNVFLLLCLAGLSGLAGYAR